jgi:hypothetical protein
MHAHEPQVAILQNVLLNPNTLACLVVFAGFSLLLLRSIRLQELLGSLQKRVFVGVAWAIILLVGTILVREVLRPKPDAAIVSALATVILLAALCAQVGSDLIARIKRIGPLELFEQKVEGMLSKLEAMSRKIPGNALATKFSPSDLSSEEVHNYKELDFYAMLLELSGQKPEDGKHREDYFRLLFYVASGAARQNDWLRAITLLERLVEISQGKFQPGEVYFNLGFFYFSRALQVDTGRRRLLEKAYASFSVAPDPNDVQAHFFRGYIEDELEDFGLAIRSNQAALRIRPQLASAKYNQVVSLTKLGRLRLAWARLKKIKPTDEDAKGVLQLALTDEEIKPLREDPKLGAVVTEFLKRSSGSP